MPFDSNLMMTIKSTLAVASTNLVVFFDLSLAFSDSYSGKVLSGDLDDDFNVLYDSHG